MASKVGTGTWRSLLLLGSLAVTCGVPVTTLAAPPALERLENLAPPKDDPTPAPHAWWWRNGAARMQDLMRESRRRARLDDPDWLRFRERRELIDARMAAAVGDACLVLQKDRPDGTDLLTARYTLHDGGRLRAYAGAGLSRAKYYHADADEPGPVRLSKGNRSTSMGPAAELGAELQVSERVRFGADLRWAEIDGRAIALQSDLGPVSAAPLLIEISVGYRFR